MSELHIGGEAPAAPLAEASEAGFTVRVARADGEKCERCWHYESDVADHRLASGEGGRICGRCRGILTG